MKKGFLFGKVHVMLWPENYGTAYQAILWDC